MMSPLDITVDAVQTAAIIVLVGVAVIGGLRADHRFEQQHVDLQGVIVSQFDILKQLNAQGVQIQGNRDRLEALELRFADSTTKKRLRRLEGSNDPNSLHDM